jgi:hypothetical protein
MLTKLSQSMHHTGAGSSPGSPPGSSGVGSMGGAGSSGSSSSAGLSGIGSSGSMPRGRASVAYRSIHAVSLTHGGPCVALLDRNIARAERHSRMRALAWKTLMVHLAGRLRTMVLPR